MRTKAICWRMTLAVWFAAIPPCLNAQVAVSSSGQATYHVPIAVPPGIAGMEPKLSLSYAEGGINGPVGVGWSIQGISSITRCPSSRAVDGFVRPVGFGFNDKLCLDGQRLIQTAIDAPANTPASSTQVNDAAGLTSGFREYRTEKDVFARIRAYGIANGGSDTNNGPAYFKVWTKSGLIYEYGTNPNNNAGALINAQGKTVAAVWAVSRMSDTVGNVVDFKYAQRDIAFGSGPESQSGGIVQPPVPSTGHEWYVKEIQYGSNKVIFNYGDRSLTTWPFDASEAYHNNSKNVSIARLDSIATYINSPNTTLGPGTNAVAASTYKLAYAAGANTKRSRVTSIRQCAGDPASTICMPPTSFDYDPGGSEAYISHGSFKTSPLATTTFQDENGTYGVLVGDFNGDGRSDLLRWNNTPASNRLYTSNGDGTFTEVPVGSGTGQFNLTDLSLFHRPNIEARADLCYMSVVVDVNGDGMADIVRWAAPTTANIAGATDCPSGQQTLVLLSRGDGSFQRVPITNSSGGAIPLYRRIALVGTCGSQTCYQGRNFYLGDFDGDGRLDIAEVWMEGAYFSGSDWVCTLGTTNCFTKVHLGRGDGTFNSPVSVGAPAWSEPTRSNQSYVMDVNGDGMADLVLRPQSIAAGLVLVSQGTSQGSLTFTRFSGLPSCVQPWGGTTKDTGYFQWGDFNGDGRADFICAQSPATNNRVYISTGGFSFIANGPSTTSGKLSLNTTSTNLVSPGGTAPNASYSILDFNGDGRSDVLRISDNASLNAIYISNGDGTFTQSTTFTFDGGAGELTRSDGTASFVIGDFTGRGNVEFLRFRRDAASATTDPGKNILYVKADPKAPDLLRTVTSSTGLVTQITRATMASAGDRYVSDRAPAGNPNAAAYPNVDLTAAMPIVTAVEEATGVGASTTRTDYAYRGFKGTYTGRGALGFREMRVQRPAPNGEARTVVTRYLQEHPYIGVAAVSQTYLGDLSLSAARLISRTTNSYCDKTAQASPANIGTPGDAPNPCVPPSSQVPKPLIQRPFLYQSVEEGWDPATIPGITLPRITTTNTYNDAADPLQIEVVTEGTALGSLSQTTRRTTTNVYDPDTTAGDAWRLGRLQRTTVNAQVPNSLPSITTAAGSSPHATERQGTGSPTGTLNPAVLSAILQLLLDD